MRLKGDYFELQPGTIHSLGAGVCVLEPQRSLYGKSEKHLDYGTGIESIITREN